MEARSDSRRHNARDLTGRQMTGRSANLSSSARGRRCLALAVALVLFAPGDALASGPPTVSSVWVTGVTTTSALLHAEIDPQGLATQYRFEYLTLADYEANLAVPLEGFAGAARAPAVDANLGTTPLTVFFQLGSGAYRLLPGTAYAYRVVATNEAGTRATPAHFLHTRSLGGSGLLPDARAWELVSPVDKAGGAVAGPAALFGGGDIQAAAAGGALTYGSATAFAGPSSAPPASQYLSRRHPDGWSTENLSQPFEAGGYGDDPDGAPFRLFSGDLGRALMLDGRRCAVEETCPPSYSLWDAGSLQALPTVPGLRFEGAAADLHRLVFGADAGLYEWSGGVLEALSGSPDAALAAPVNAISAAGSRVYFTASPEGPIYLHEDGGGNRLLPESSGPGTAFQAASATGAVGYFSRAGTLYRYLAATETSTPIATGVAGVLAISADGSRVYYQDASGLQAWHEGSVDQIAPGADATAPSDYPPATATVRLSADGTVLAFLSAASLGGFENVNADTGMPDVEVYRYDADADSLLCASCNPTGERPAGSASIPGALVNGTTGAYRPRALSADGRRLFFDSSDSLVPGDSNSSPDVYQWEAPGSGSCAEQPGCVSLISGGRGEGGIFLDASADGADAFFLTGDSLVDADPGSIDAYDARIGGGFPEPETAIPCIADACQPLPSPPDDPGATTSLTSSGNPAPHYAKEAARSRRCPEGKRKVRRHGKVRCVKSHRRHSHHRRRGGR